MTDSLTTQIIAKFDTLESKLGTLESRLDTKFNALDTKFDVKFSAMDVRVDRLENNLNNRLDNLELEIIDVKNEQRLMHHALVDQLDDVERLRRLHPNFSHS